MRGGVLLHTHVGSRAWRTPLLVPPASGDVPPAGRQRAGRGTSKRCESQSDRERNKGGGGGGGDRILYTNQPARRSTTGLGGRGKKKESDLDPLVDPWQRVKPVRVCNFVNTREAPISRDLTIQGK